MEETQARTIFSDLGSAFSAQELKASFRRKSLVLHPDMGGSEKDFIELNDAFGILSSLAKNGIGANLETVDGIKLSELGKGYPLSVSAISCENCEGKGWKSFTSDLVKVKCLHCDGTGAFYLPCKKCNGTGRYKHPKTGNDVGQCNLCLGSGKFYPRRKERRPCSIHFLEWDYRQPLYVTLPSGERIPVNSCKECGGDGFGVVPGRNFLYTICPICKGVGETKIYNPVLPRGFLKAKG
jgi:DnaJ-class molecular chaperone